MSQPILDCRGLSCPLPVMKVKEKLEQGSNSFSVLVDTNICVENISRFLDYRGVPFTITENAAGSCIEVRAQSE